MEEAVIGAAAPASSAPADQAPSTPDATSQAAQPSDGFNVDEAVLATLTPESRAAIDPMIKQFKDQFDKVQSSSKSLKEKADTLDKLTNWPKFQEWYRGEMNPKPVQQDEKIDPKDQIESLEQELSTNAADPIKYYQTLDKIMDLKYGTKVQELNSKSKNIELSMELDSLSRAHPDVWELDKAGLFEPFLYYYTDLHKRPMVEAYNMAKKVGDFFSKQAQAKATGIVQNAKASVTEPPSKTASDSQGVVYAPDGDTAMRMQIEEFMPGGQRRQVVVKK